MLFNYNYTYVAKTVDVRS